MNNLFWTAIRIPAVIDPLSEYGVLHARFSQPTELINVDDVKFSLFVTSVDNPINAITVELAEEGTIEDVFNEIVAHLYSSDDATVLIDKGLAAQVYNEKILPMLVIEP